MDRNQSKCEQDQYTQRYAIVPHPNISVAKGEPTFGYIVSLPLLAYLSGLFYNKDKKYLAVLLPLLSIHLLGIFYLFIFKQAYLDLAWYMSFSMIGYDMLFAFLLLPVMPLFSFILTEIFIQEVPSYDSKSFKFDNEKYKKIRRRQSI